MLVRARSTTLKSLLMSSRIRSPLKSAPRLKTRSTSCVMLWKRKPHLPRLFATPLVTSKRLHWTCTNMQRKRYYHVSHACMNISPKFYQINTIVILNKIAWLFPSPRRTLVKADLLVLKRLSSRTLMAIRSNRHSSFVDLLFLPELVITET